MTSIQKQAAELAEEFKNCGDKYTQIYIAYRMAALLRQIASIGENVEPVAYLARRSDWPPEQFEPFLAYKPWMVDVKQLYTAGQLDAARLAGFEAGRRKGLEDAANACDRRSSSSVTANYRNGASDCAALIRFLINKEA